MCACVCVCIQSCPTGYVCVALCFLWDVYIVIMPFPECNQNNGLVIIEGV